jgi:hypothetical protein
MSRFAAVPPATISTHISFVGAWGTQKQKAVFRNCPA